MFPTDPGGGSGDSAYIRYYPRSGESTTLEIGITNDADDHISLMPSGNVGIGTLTPGTVPVRAAVLTPRPAINAQVSGPPVDLRFAVAGSNVACTPVALSIEVQSAALQGQGAVTVQVTTDQGDREALNLPEIAPGRFARTTIPLARTGGTRPGNGVVDVVDPGSTLTVTFVDAQPLAGQPPVRPLTGSVRVQ